MPVPTTYPGVYIREVPSGVRTIIGVGTSITAFIGRALRGPVDTPVRIHSFADFDRIFGGLWVDSTLSYAVQHYFLNGGREAIIVRVDNGAEAASISLDADEDSLELVAANPGAWGNDLRVIVDHDTGEDGDGELFNLTVQEVDRSGEQPVPVQEEQIRRVSVAEGAERRVDSVLEEESDLVRVEDGDSLPSDRPDETLDGDGEPEPVDADDGSGADGDPIDESSQITDPSLEEPKQGLWALEDADLFNLLCIPPAEREETLDPSSVAAALEYCEERRAFLLVDPEASSTWNRPADVEVSSLHDGGPRQNGAVFFPRIRAADPMRDNQVFEFAPCGAVAGVIARIDAERGVWKAPAGQEATLNGVRELAIPLTDAENGVLNPQGVNCLRTFGPVGSVVWGSRTLEGADRLASEWKYIPVRRTALFIEESLFRGLKWVVFEPNDEPLWAEIRLSVGAFMHDLFRQGAFQGATPKEAYFVKCDSETTTQNDINRGIVNIWVGFAPLKPAEFVILHLQQMAGQVQT